MKKYYILLSGAMLIATLQTQAQTKIGGAGAPDNSAMLEVTGGAGNNKGILPPRLTTVQRNAITLPATGLLIYNTTTNQLQVNTGTPAAPIWSISSGSNAWNQTGNAATNPATNFIGTTDNQPLVMRTNAVERLRVDSTTGNVGINDATPRGPLSFGSAHGSKIRLYDNDTDTLVYGFGISNSSLNYIVENTDLASHRFWSGGSNDNGTELMRIQGNGNVGIATPSPAQTLHVQGTARVTGSTGTPTTIAGRNAAGDISNVAIGTGLSLTSGTLSATVSNPGWALGGNTGTNPATNYIGTTDAQPLVMRTNATEHMRITPAGNVGINNATPISPLSFAPSLGNKIAFFDGGSNTQYLGIGVSSSQLNYHVGSNSGHVFYAGGTNGDGTELMRVQNTGNVGISNSAPLSPLSFASTVGPKISLYDLGSATTHYGLGVSAGQLNYQIMAGAHSFRTGGKNDDGTELMRIQSDGNVGISNSAPLSPLSFASTLGSKVSFYDGGSTTEYLGIGVSSSQLNYHVTPNASHVFYGGGKNGDGTELMRIIGSNGNVGIGTAAPAAKLDVNGTARIQGSAGTPTFITGRDAAGNINNITLGANLSLAGGVLSATGGGTAGWGLTGNAGTTPATNFIGTTDAQPLVFRTNNTEYMRVMSDGRVGIGTSTPSPTALLDVDSGNISLTPTYGLHWGNSPLGERMYTYWNLGPTGYNMFLEAREHMVFIADRNNSSNNSNSIGFIWATNASWLDGGTPSEWMRLTDAGNLGIGTSSPGYKLDVVGDINASNAVRAGGVILTSDVRLKCNIKNAQHGLSTIMKLNPVEYEKKNTIQDSVYDRHEIGFIAQEVAKVLPTLVTEGKDADKTLAVSYTELIPVLTKAIQELNTQVETLKSENQELKENKVATAQLMERVKQMEQMMGIKEIEGTSKVAGK